jgi:hypothetical protein
MDVKPVITRPMAKISTMALMMSGLPPMASVPQNAVSKVSGNQIAILDFKNQKKD